MSLAHELALRTIAELQHLAETWDDQAKLLDCCELSAEAEDARWIAQTCRAAIAVRPYWLERI